MAPWSFLSKHGLALLSVGQHLDSTDQEIGQGVGLGERAVRKIMTDLAVAQYVEPRTGGKYNRHRLHPAVCSAEQAEQAAPLRDLQRALQSREDAGHAVRGAVSRRDLFTGADTDHLMLYSDRWRRTTQSG